jgi:hypothetical protein
MTDNKKEQEKTTLAFIAVTLPLVNWFSPATASTNVFENRSGFLPSSM